MSVRDRAIPAAIGLAAFILLGRAVDYEFWQQWWFYVGLATAISAVFLEPYFTRPQDAIVNSLAGAGAWASADRDSVRPLWAAFLVFVLIVAASGLLATLVPPITSNGLVLTAKQVTNQISTKMGTAVVIGGSALAIEVVRLAREQKSGYVQLALGTSALVLALVPDWAKIINRILGRDAEEALALAAYGPRLLLVRASEGLESGGSLEIKGPNGTARGWVTASLPGTDGPLAEITLDRDTNSLCSTFPMPLEIKPTVHDAVVVGSVGAGTTETRVNFHATADLQIGDPLSLGENGDSRIFQVTELELRRESWSGAGALIPTASALQVGRPEAGWIRMHPMLPRPHAMIVRPKNLYQGLPEAYVRVGVLKGTSIEIGVDPTMLNSGHFAILGMSGMGKTSAAVALCTALGVNSCVLAVDATGEYRTRLRIPTDLPANFDQDGFWVHEPKGDLPLRARECIKRVMDAANAEYEREVTPHPRVIVLEEAHGFLPEWNIATRAQQDDTAYSTRLIMQARKFNIRFVIISQRTAVVSKSALTQCENYIALRAIDETGLAYLDAAIGQGVGRAISNLERHEAVCAGPAFNVDGPVIVSLDAPSTAAGNTPASL